MLGCSEWLLFSRYFAQERYDTLDSVADVSLNLRRSLIFITPFMY